jgi:hypothetical protein
MKEFSARNRIDPGRGLVQVLGLRREHESHRAGKLALIASTEVLGLNGNELHQAHCPDDQFETFVCLNGGDTFDSSH